jgi:hypothetical protein
LLHAQAVRSNEQQQTFEQQSSNDIMCLISSTNGEALHPCEQQLTSQENTICLPIKAALLELQELTKLLMLTGL